MVIFLNAPLIYDTYVRTYLDLNENGGIRVSKGYVPERLKCSPKFFSRCDVHPHYDSCESGPRLRSLCVVKINRYGC